MVNLMHISTHITSYMILIEEVDCVDGKEVGGLGVVSIGLAGGK